MYVSPYYCSLTYASPFSVRYCVPWRNTIVGNVYTDVECVSFPNELDRASAAEQAGWQWTVANNTNTRPCHVTRSTPAKSTRDV